MFNLSTFHNTSGADGDHAKKFSSWDFRAVFNISIATLVIITNVPTLLCFIKDARLRKQPFSVYLIFLLCINTAYAVLQDALELVVRLYSPQWLGGSLCIVYKYLTVCLTCCQMFAHDLITMSRLYAVTFPLTYRRVHSRKMAITLCLLMCVYVHAVQLPGFIPAMAHLKLPLKLFPCSVQYSPSKVQNILTFVVSFGIVILSYPYIAYKRSMRRISQRKIQPVSLRSKKSAPTIVITAAAGAAETTDQSGDLTTKMEAAEKKLPKRPQQRSNAFTVLTLLTASTLLFWSPAVVTQTIYSFMPVINPRYNEIAFSMFAFQPILDPLLFTVALKDLQAAFCAIFGTRASRAKKFTP